MLYTLFVSFNRRRHSAGNYGIYSYYIDLNPTNNIILLHILGKCDSKDMPERIECGWSNIAKEQCLARGCCFDNYRIDAGVNCFVKRYLGE